MDDILARLERIERRLDALESRGAPVYRQSAPPVYAPAPPPPGPPTADPADDLESIIGARWLPRVGALAVVAALAYLVALGLQRGIITPAMVVVGIALACLGAIGLGLRLRDEREAYGHVLVGIGAGGLYVDAVGAHLYQGLIGSEAMVGACLAVSLASLGYGFWRALPAFLGIGLSGGLVAALMPLAKDGTATAAGLLILVAVPAFAVAGGRRWPMAVVASWVACALAALPILLSRDVVVVRLLPLDAILLLAAGAWVWSTKGLPETDPQGAFPFVASALSGITSLNALNGPGGAAHLAALGAAVGLTGLSARSRESGSRTALAGLSLVLIVAPFGFSFYQAAAVLAGLALVEAVVLRRRLAPIVAAQAALAIGTYASLLLVAYSENRFLSVGFETCLIVLLGSAAVAAAVVVDRREARIAAGVVAWGLVTRLALLALDLPDNATITVAWTVVLGALLIVGFLRKRPELRQLGLVVALATAGKVVLVDLAGLDPGLKAAVLLGLGLTLLAGGYGYVRSKGNLGA